MRENGQIQGGLTRPSRPPAGSSALKAHFRWVAGLHRLKPAPPGNDRSASRGATTSEVRLSSSAVLYAEMRIPLHGCLLYALARL